MFSDIEMMTPSERHFYSWVLLGIGIVAVLVNSLLIRVARRIRQTSEIRLAVTLSSVDMAIPTLAIGASLLDNWSGDGLDHLQALCQIKGPLDFLLQYTSLMMVAMIAIERYAKVRGSETPKPVLVFFGLYTLVYVGMVLAAAFRSEFYTSPSGCDCAPIATNSVLSASVIFTLGFSMFLFLIVTIYSYLRILTYVKATTNKANSKASRTKVFLRVVTIYLLLIAPSSILIMMEGTYNSEGLDKLSMAISILVALIAIANPCLVLFAHSLTFGQLRYSITSMRSSSSELDAISLDSVPDN